MSARQKAYVELDKVFKEIEDIQIFKKGDTVNVSIDIPPNPTKIYTISVTRTMN